MPTSRQRRVIMKQLYYDFKTHGITKTPTYKEYVKEVESPVTLRHIKKQFTLWKRAVASTERLYPDLYSDDTKIDSKEEPLQSLEALRAMSEATKQTESSDE